jgi:hypothetical protein
MAEQSKTAIIRSPAITIQLTRWLERSLAMSKAYIKGGTPVGSESLCRTCAHAQIMRGYRESELITICTDVYPSMVLPFTVYECTGYYDKNRPSWKQMEDLAIDVTPAPLKPVGFKVGPGFLSEFEEREEDREAVLRNVRGRLL